MNTVCAFGTLGSHKCFSSTRCGEPDAKYCSFVSDTEPEEAASHGVLPTQRAFLRAGDRPGGRWKLSETAGDGGMKPFIFRSN